MMEAHPRQVQAAELRSAEFVTEELEALWETEPHTARPEEEMIVTRLGAHEPGPLAVRKWKAFQQGKLNEL